MNILFEDNHLIAVNKLPGQIVQGDKTGDKTLGDFLKDYIKEKYQKPGKVFLGTIHRLDRPVSGVVLYAKTSKGLERMNEQFREKEIQKTYWAIVENKPAESSGTLIHYLLKNEKQNKSYIVAKEKAGALKSELDYSLITSSDKYHLLQVLPKTGRHHQIRVQLSSMGCIIKGDLKYGAKRSNADGSICLHARQIEFMHPVKKEPVKIIANPPDNPLWNYFLTFVQNFKAM